MEDTIFAEREKNEIEFNARRRKSEMRAVHKSSSSTLLSEKELKAIEEGKKCEFEDAMRAAGLNFHGKMQEQNKHKDQTPVKDDRNSENVCQSGRFQFEYTKARYYFEKLGITPADDDIHGAIRQHYLEGLLWCLAYYYRGCVSWNWFYPFHYGPMMSDMVQLSPLKSKIKFVKGKPFLPFEQLLGCLPAASAQFLPKSYQVLMTDPKSPIIDFYPLDFKVDMNGKRNPWEGNFFVFAYAHKTLILSENLLDILFRCDLDRIFGTKGSICCHLSMPHECAQPLSNNPQVKG